jgi:hypothetical protein
MRKRLGGKKTAYSPSLKEKKKFFQDSSELFVNTAFVDPLTIRFTYSKIRPQFSDGMEVLSLILLLL